MSTEVDTRRVSALDGMRGLAIVLVITAHLLRSAPSVGSIGAWCGYFGVMIFFVLSGYLITRVMLADEQEAGRLRMRRFYARRALRILPALYAFLALVFVLGYLHWIPQPDGRTWLSSLLYLRNFGGTGWETGHLWTLALEEQFYLIWPLLFVLTRRYRCPALIAAIVAVALWRSYWLLSHAPGHYLIDRPDMNLDCFLMGAAFSLRAQSFTDRSSVWLWLAGAFLSHLLIPIELNSTVVSFCLAGAVSGVVANHADGLARVFRLQPVVWLGVGSYSVYLFQQVLIRERVYWWTLPLLAILAAASYFLIEKPFLNLKARLTF